MTKPLLGNVEYSTNTGRIKDVTKISNMIYNKKKETLIFPRDVKIVEAKDGKIYVKELKWNSQPREDEFSKDELIENFLWLSPEEVQEIVQFRDSNNEYIDKMIVYLNNLHITEDTHPFNKEVVDYLKTAFDNKLYTRNKKDCNLLIKELENNMGKPYSHKKLTKLLEYIGSSYKELMEWIKNKNK